MVVDVSKRFMPNLSVGFSNPKLTLNIGDGFEFMKNHKAEFDVIITDSSDPVGKNTITVKCCQITKAIFSLTACSVIVA